MTNPGDGDLAVFEPGKNVRFRLAVTRGEPAFQDQLLKKSARVEMFCGREVLERAWNFPARRRRAVGRWLRHARESSSDGRADQFDFFAGGPSWLPSVQDGQAGQAGIAS